MRRPILEICIERVADAIAARDGGADRVELCAALGIGGVTPSMALVDAVVEVGLPVHVLLRPGDGGFVYDAAGIRAIAADIADASRRGAAGVVVGALTAAGDLDRAALAIWRDAAEDIDLTLHRAVDLARSPTDAVETAADLRIDHILTSGGARNAREGLSTLAAMARAADGRVSIIAAAGVSDSDARVLLIEGGVDALHASASVREPWSDPRIAAFGFGAAQTRRTSVERVAALRHAIDVVYRTNQGHS